MKTKTNIPAIIGTLIYLIYSFVETVICDIPNIVKIPLMIIAFVLLLIGIVLLLIDSVKEKKKNNKSK